MNQPIIISAFGTTTRALDTYDLLNRSIRDHFPKREIIWAYSSKQIVRQLKETSGPAISHPGEVLARLEGKGITRATIQSLHLFPGKEFHSLVKVAAGSKLQCTIGKPLLTSPEDYRQLGEILHPLISKRAEKALLLLGHGTDHPTWTAYFSLEKILRRSFGRNIFVGVVEKYPNTDHLVEEIADRGYRKVCIIPLFLVAGMHYRRDIISEAPSSWLSRLRARKLEVEVIDHGLGLWSGFEEIINRHISEAELVSVQK